MKIFYLCCALLQMALAQSPDELILKTYFEQLGNNSLSDNFDVQEGGIIAVIDDFADRIISNLQRKIVLSGLDPMPMDDIPLKIEQKVIIITFTGELNLTKGWLRDISTLKRDGTTTVSYSTTSKILSVTLPLVFDSLMIDYDYLVNVLGLIQTNGDMDVHVTDFKMILRIDIDFNTYKGSVGRYEVIKGGDYIIKFHGNLIYDWLIDLASTVSLTALKPLVRTVIERITKGVLSDVLDNINDIVEKILHPPPEEIANLISSYFNN